MSYRLGIDIGGTFTDFILIDDKGSITLNKVASTSDPSEAILAGLNLLADGSGLSIEQLLERCGLIIHGTTVVTNALIHKKFAKTGLITTRGFRDILETRQGHKEGRYDWFYPLPPEVIPRRLRLEVTERVWRNRVLMPLNESDVLQAADYFKQEKVEAVAVCLLWSFINPNHEKRIKEILHEHLPETYVSISSEVLPKIREYQRVSTTAINAAIGPVIVRYLDHIEKLLASLNYKGYLRYMQSNAGIAASDLLKQKPVLAINSGPAAAPVAGLWFGHLFQKTNLITIDMGGTSFDACLVHDDSVDMTMRGTDVHRFRIGTPAVNISTIGAGGGSIAWIDTGGILRVGPQSAEAVPGPACYAKGNTEPTVTDANVVLGYFSSESLLGGKLSINGELSHRAVEEKIAKPLRLSSAHAALGIFDIVNTNMANSIRAISVERGYDTRNFTLVAGGGCGPAHAGRLAEEMEIGTVFIPKVASAFCAFGSVVADIRHDYNATYPVRFPDIDCDKLNHYFEDLERQAYVDLGLEGVSRDDVHIQRSMEIRYVGEGSECVVPIPGVKITKEKINEIEEAFDREHERLYTFRDPDSIRELLNVGVTASGAGARVEIRKQPYAGKDPAQAKNRTRKALFKEYYEYVETPVYEGGKIQAGNIIRGPAIVEEESTTIVVFPEWQLKLEENDVYVMSRLLTK
jgi:N-methylhydantoinase A